jgi:hypothetical protein
MCFLEHLVEVAILNPAVSVALAVIPPSFSLPHLREFIRMLLMNDARLFNQIHMSKTPFFRQPFFEAAYFKNLVTSVVLIIAKLLLSQLCTSKSIA